MAKSNSTDFTLNKLDDLFSTQDERDNADKPEIRDIDIWKYFSISNSR